MRLKPILGSTLPDLSNVRTDVVIISNVDSGLCCMLNSIAVECIFMQR